MTIIVDELTAHIDELHNSTVVVNTYGGPYTSANVLRKFRIGRWHHEQGEFEEGNPPFIGNVLAPEMKVGGVDIVLGGYANLADHGLWMRDMEESADVGRFVSNVADMHVAKDENKIGLQICLHGPHSIKDGFDLLYVHKQLGASVFTLCSSYRNEIVDGCREPDNAGLSRYGQRVVAELNRLKIAIDVSHISEQGLKDVLDHTTTPILTTHTAAKAICDSPRNFSDEQLKAIVDGGGYIGVIFFPTYLNKDHPTIEHLLDHIDHIAELVGPEYIGLGADFCQYGWEWTSLSWARSNMPERRYKFPDDIEDTTQWKNVTRGLIRRGYTDNEIKGILGGNYLRVLENILA